MSPPDVSTGVPGNALPSSSAVRRAPQTARTASDPHRAQRSAVSSRPHQRHTAPIASRSGSESGPVQCLQRAIVRQRPQANAGTYPLRGTWTRTGRPASSADRAACSAIDGSRALCAAGSRSLAKRSLPARSHAAPGTARPASAPPGRVPTDCAPWPAPRRFGSIRRIIAAQRNWCARSIPTSRACGYGARGSERLSSPSSQTSTSPRSATGANTALRVPITSRAERRSTDSHRRYRCAGPSPAESATTRLSSTNRTAAS